MVAMILGGGLTLFLIILDKELPLGLDPNFYGICLAAVSFFILQGRDKAYA